ncbi:hypothetical protein V5P93_003924 [Actinokineospora auranticolor]|uniref:NB-ARC domain-containing protein n=1 Tax=Actinokineospora auranticolor TaxID=155976 RepID=A0A2S6GM18_9PSEU|nr:hypothetical protein [Actinokineospora auranticolor]PPK66206.1 hypothetical protein CLV40_111170 [Actinokineospora auranticolor]
MSPATAVVDGVIEDAAVSVPVRRPGVSRYVEPLEAVSRLDRLDVEAGGAPRVVVTGAPGVGTSALVAWWAARTAHRFPGGVRCLDVRERPGVSVAAVLAGWLREMGLDPEAVSGEEAALVAVWRAVTAERPVTLVLDHVVDRVLGVVEALLPGPGSAVLITSVDRLSDWRRARGFALTRLGPLAPEGAVAVMRAWLDPADPRAEPKRLGPVAWRLGSVPLALATAGALLAAHPGLTPEELAAVLPAPAVGPGPAIEATLAASVAALDEPMRRLFLAVGWHPGPTAGVAAVAAGLEWSAARVAAGCAALAERTLLLRAGPGRWRVHHAHRAHLDTTTAAAAAWTAEDRDGVREGIIAWYADRAAAAAVALDPHTRRHHPALRATEPGAVFTTPADAHAWALTARDTVVDVLDAAARHGHHDLTAALAEVMPAISPLAGRDPVALARADRHGHRAATALGQDVLAAVFLTRICRGLTDQGVVDAAIAGGRDAVTAAAPNGDAEVAADAEAALAAALHRAGRLDEALTHADRATAHAERAGAPRVVARRLRERGAIHHERGDHTAAETDRALATALLDGIGDDHEPHPAP